MTLCSPLVTLSLAMASAQCKDMPEVAARRRKSNFKPFAGTTNSKEYAEWLANSFENYQRRPYNDELYVEAMFPQTWGSTALGFGGVGGQALTTAYTTIIGCENGDHYCVYFGSQFAYTLDSTKIDMEIFAKDIMNKSMAEVRQRSRYLKKD